jgi:hypothetical protein
MIPDRLPDSLRAPIRQFPAGALQFEGGIQTINEEVSHRISRRQDNLKVEENLRFLRDQTGVHVHADLIVGLPGEGVESFAAGFDRLVALRPQEIQVGMLKRLRGTPIVRHDAEFGMAYSEHAPYEVLQTRDVDFATMQRLRRFARYWDLVANSGNFAESAPLLWREGSPFQRFITFADRLYEQVGKSHAIALNHLAELLFAHLLERGHDPAEVAAAMWRDYRRGGRADCPEFLRDFVPDAERRAARAERLSGRLPPRQARHLVDRA